MARRENWIKWDLDSRLGLKMATYFAEHGIAGYGFFVVVVEMLYRADGYKLPYKFIQKNTNLYKSIETDTNAYINSLVELGLFSTDEKQEFIWSERVIEEAQGKQKKQQEVSKARVDAVNSRWQKDKIQTDTNAYKAIQSDTKTTDKRRGDKIRIDKSINNNIHTLKTKFGEYVFLSDTEIQKFKTDLGQEVLDRCIEKLDAWIASDPTIKRKKNGQNAAACFRSWVINSVAEEQARASKVSSPNFQNNKMTNAEKSMQAAANLIKKAEAYGI